VYDIGEFFWPMEAARGSLDDTLRMLAIWQTGAYDMCINLDLAVLPSAEMGS
jgi:hypothetical protein